MIMYAFKIIISTFFVLSRYALFCARRFCFAETEFDCCSRSPSKLQKLYIPSYQEYLLYEKFDLRRH